MEPAAKTAALKASPIFDNLLSAEFEFLDSLFDVCVYGAGEVILDAARHDDSIYVIALGVVEILHQDSEGALGSVATLQASEFLGEMSIMKRDRPSTTARAQTEVTLLRLSAASIKSFGTAYPSGLTWVTVNMARVLSARLREINRTSAG